MLRAGCTNRRRPALIAVAVRVSSSVHQPRCRCGLAGGPGGRWRLKAGRLRSCLLGVEARRQVVHVLRKLRRLGNPNGRVDWGANVRTSGQGGRNYSMQIMKRNRSEVKITKSGNRKFGHGPVPHMKKKNFRTAATWRGGS